MKVIGRERERERERGKEQPGVLTLLDIPIPSTQVTVIAWQSRVSMMRIYTTQRYKLSNSKELDIQKHTGKELMNVLAEKDL